MPADLSRARALLAQRRGASDREAVAVVTDLLDLVERQHKALVGLLALTGDEGGEAADAAWTLAEDLADEVADALAGVRPAAPALGVGDKVRSAAAAVDLDLMQVGERGRR